MELSIAKEKYRSLRDIKTKLSYEKWVDYIDRNSDYYEWLENTERGKERLKNIEKIPESFRLGILQQLNKRQAFAQFNPKKGWHEIVIDFHIELGLIKITNMKRLKQQQLGRLVEMADYLGGYLLNNGTEIISPI
ncbi:hypothetical protein [Pedobacter sp. SYSU D00535]|uniref:hypothetical protein n=1 Tax=Pedobacter sp. SYSU D00535 TaxID=2810308 RepID=UPI001A97B916|nr:hypothetical protein [Pedobacter sp. SYSU D00535]